MTVRMVSLIVFLLAAFIAFGDYFIAYMHSSPQTFVNDIGRSIGNAIATVGGWFGLR